MSEAEVSPTQLAHHELASAFHELNQRLFKGELPECLITLQRKHGTRGYFAAHRFIRADTVTAHEIGINPQIFALATLPEVLSELCHNMTHLWAHLHRQQGRRGYHSKGWAAKMEELGLMPSSTGKPGGKTTGEKVEHYIITGGAFDEAVKVMEANGLNITWLDRLAEPWVEGRDADGDPARGEHLLGGALLGRTGLLVDGAPGDEEQDLGAPNDAPQEGAFPSTQDGNKEVRDDGGISIPATTPDAGGVEVPASYVSDRDGSAREDEGIRSDLEHGAPAANTAGLHDGIDSGRAEAFEAGGQQPVVLETGNPTLKGGRGGKPEHAPTPVPLIAIAGQDLEALAAKKRRDKTKFTCPSCSQKAWAKPTAKLDCGECKVAMSGEREPAD